MGFGVIAEFAEQNLLASDVWLGQCLRLNARSAYWADFEGQTVMQSTVEHYSKVAWELPCNHVRRCHEGSSAFGRLAASRLGVGSLGVIWLHGLL